MLLMRMSSLPKITVGRTIAWLSADPRRTAHQIGWVGVRPPSRAPREPARFLEVEGGDAHAIAERVRPLRVPGEGPDRPSLGQQSLCDVPAGVPERSGDDVEAGPSHRRSSFPAHTR